MTTIEYEIANTRLQAYIEILSAITNKLLKNQDDLTTHFDSGLNVAWGLGNALMQDWIQQTRIIEE